MKKLCIISALVILGACSISRSTTGMKRDKLVIPAGTYADTLRYLYSLSADLWPAPFIDSGIVWQELGIVPESPLTPYLDSLKHAISLGRTLFFDPRLSGSNQISCSSCHIPDLSWTDGREKSLGHDHKINKRNSPSLLNVWYYKRLFWDGRSGSLEDQAFSPINSETEMHSDMPEVMYKLRKIEGYRPLFKAAFGSEEISPETVTEALAIFQRTLVSHKADFDDFIAGNKQAMSDAAVRGLHLFRTKARCMNCHHGPLFSDNSFHNTGLAGYKTDEEDLGRYYNTRLAEDAGKFKTPSLRDVMRTRPWMHHGLFDNIDSVVGRYNAGIPSPGINEKNDPLYPKTDPLLIKLELTRQERMDLVAFLHAITAEPAKTRQPTLPQ